MADAEPLFEHDCGECVFLGTTRKEVHPPGTFQERDLYFCGPENPTVVARRSSEGSDYISGLTFRHVDAWLGEAYRRAQAKGLIS